MGSEKTNFAVLFESAAFLRHFENMPDHRQKGKVAYAWDRGSTIRTNFARSATDMRATSLKPRPASGGYARSSGWPERNRRPANRIGGLELPLRRPILDLTCLFWERPRWSDCFSDSLRRRAYSAKSCWTPNVAASMRKGNVDSRRDFELS